MKAVIKWLGVLVVLLVVLLLAAVFVLPKVIDPNDYKVELEQLVMDKTGLRMSIRGPVAWSVFPWVGFGVEKVQVAGVNGKSLADLNKAELSIRLLPLLQRQVEMDTVTLDGLVLTLVKDKNGKGNWETTKPSPSTNEDQSSSPDTSPDQQPEPPATKAGGDIELNIAQLDIKNLAVDYRDMGTGEHYVLTDMYLNAGPVRLGEKFSMKSGLNLRMDEQKLALGLLLSGDVSLDLATQTYELQQFLVKVTPLDTNNPEVVTLNTEMRIQSKNDSLRLDGSFALQPLDARALMGQLKLPAPETGNPEALQRVSMTATLHAEGNAASLEPVHLEVDDFQMDGSIQITDIKKQALAFNLKGNSLNLDNYLPGEATVGDTKTSGEAQKPATTQSATTQPAGKPDAGDVALIPVDLLRTLNLDGQLRLERLTAKKLVFSNPELVINAHQGVLQLKKLEAGFYDGAIRSNGQLDARKTPKLNIEAAMNGVNLGTLAAVMPQLEQVDGKANFNMALTSQGMTQNQLTQKLNGNVAFNVADGAFKGTNFNKLVCEAVSKVRNKTLTRTDWPEDSTFSSLGGTVQIKNGVATNKDLAAELSTLRMKGDGNVDLVRQQLDYHVGLNISGNEQADLDPACHINEKYADITWPVRCKGGLGSSGLCGIDYDRVAKLATQMAGKEVERKFEKELEKKLGDKVGKDIKDALKGFLK